MTIANDEADAKLYGAIAQAYHAAGDFGSAPRLIEKCKPAFDAHRKAIVDAAIAEHVTSGPALGPVPTEPGFYWALGPNGFIDEWEVVKVDRAQLGRGDSLCIYREEEDVDLREKVAWSVRLTPPPMPELERDENGVALCAWRDGG